MSVAICIAHAAWCPRRKANLNTMLKEVPDASVFPSFEKEPAQVWAKRLWQWGAAQDVDVVVYLNDDVELCDNFEKVVFAMWHGEPLSLHTSAPDQKTRFARCYWMTGPGYALSPAQTKSLLEFCETEPWRENEDNMGCRWAWRYKMPFVSFIPCPVRHIATIPSTLGYDDHPHRTTKHFMKALPIRSDMWDPRDAVEDVPMVTNPWFKP